MLIEIWDRAIKILQGAEKTAMQLGRKKKDRTEIRKKEKNRNATDMSCNFGSGHALSGTEINLDAK